MPTSPSSVQDPAYFPKPKTYEEDTNAEKKTLKGKNILWTGALKTLSGATKRQKRQKDGEEQCLEEAVEDLIEAARREAFHQGSHLTDGKGDSQPVSTVQGMGAFENKGSSQSFHRAVRSSFEHLFKVRSEGCNIGSLGPLIWDVLKDVENENNFRRPQSTASSKSIFPLAATGPQVGMSETETFLQGLLASLNSLHGVSASGKDNAASKRAVKRLGELVAASGILQENIPEIKFEEFWTYRGLSYDGEEVKVAKRIRWESIEPSLPKEVGQLNLVDFCSDGVLHYVQNFAEYLVPPDEMVIGKTPSVMIDPDDWHEIAHGLVDRGLCVVRKQSELFHVGGSPLLSGLFAVSKQEFQGNTEICRLIMNLKPVNSVCMGLTGDTPTLPSITGMGTMYLADDEVLLTSSEDVRCFFYLFSLPEAWIPFMGFGRAVPDDLKPPECQEAAFLCSRVLPMGFVNSVAIAQHVHRRVVHLSLDKFGGHLGADSELRRDRIFSSSNHLFRVYLDNFDELERVDRRTAELIRGTPSEVVQVLRETYLEMGLPRHPKKGVQRELKAEVQGAWIDGELGIVSAKPSKIAKYVALGLELLGRGKASQRELQVVGGGFVYISMFKRPLLCGLNQIWQMIVELETVGSNVRVWLRREVMCEIIRFIGLIPLAFMNLRAYYDEMVSVSDASTSGGGFCASRGMTPFGLAASMSNVRGDLHEELGFPPVLSIGLFDGIGALRVALDCLGIPLSGHISVETNPEAHRVVEAFFPETLWIQDVAKIDEEMVKEWSLTFSNVGLIIVGSGPPCQGVSGLNWDRKGALKDCRSALFKHVPRVVGLLRRAFPWAQVHHLTESVASMDSEDCHVMNNEFNNQPWYIDASGISLCHRPRLYWLSWEVVPGDGAWLGWGNDGRLPILGEVQLEAQVDPRCYLESGWEMPAGKALPTFTTSRPSSTPLRRPAGLKQCQAHELHRWEEDLHRFPPYQYMDVHTLQHRSSGIRRVASVEEREAILGFPANYTRQCLPKSQHDTTVHRDCRLSLLGNTWSVPVIAWLLSHLFHILGFTEALTAQDVVNRLEPGRGQSLQSILLRPPLQHSTATFPSSVLLTKKLCSLVSLKGEDLLLQSQGEAPVKFQRLRSSIPSKLWRWRIISGWRWTGDPEHINVLELRAVLTSIKWRVDQMKQNDLRCIHLVDSLVCLHALTRGRSSSRKMRRTLMRINSYLLVSGLQPLWGYVSTHDNPADRPSRRGCKKKWLKRK